MIYRKTGWGCISKVILCSTAGGVPIKNEGIGLEISGGGEGAQLRHLTVESPILTLGASLTDTLWAAMVFRAVFPSDVAFLQQASPAPPFAPSPDPITLPVPFLYYEQLIPATVNNNPLFPLILNFEDEGPSVGPNEVMSILVCPLFSPAGAIQATKYAFLNMTALGGPLTKKGTEYGDIGTLRAIDKGHLR